VGRGSLHLIRHQSAELASFGIKISFLIEGFLLLSPIRDLLDSKNFDVHLFYAKSGNLRWRTLKARFRKLLLLTVDASDILRVKNKS
jgi:hypothetical protein